MLAKRARPELDFQNEQGNIGLIGRFLTICQRKCLKAKIKADSGGSRGVTEPTWPRRSVNSYAHILRSCRYIIIQTHFLTAHMGSAFSQVLNLAD